MTLSFVADNGVAAVQPQQPKTIPPRQTRGLNRCCRFLRCRRPHPRIPPAIVHRCPHRPRRLLCTTAPASSIDRPSPHYAGGRGGIASCCRSIDSRPQRFATIEAAEGGGGSSVDVLDVLIMCGSDFPMLSVEGNCRNSTIAQNLGVDYHPNEFVQSHFSDGRIIIQIVIPIRISGQPCVP